MTRTYAIGDIHGCLAKLKRLVGICRVDAGEESARLICLGDYVDRGPDSRGVIEYLIRLQNIQTDQIICLMGNHEDMLLAAADDPDWNEPWLRNGGLQTLESYGVTDATHIPKEHIAWLRSLPKFHDDGRRFFVHAGVQPDRALDEQHDHDLLWIREPFLSSDKDFGRLIVHGHTPLASGLPDVHPNRLNLDTAAVHGGPLTAAAFTDRQTEPEHFMFAR